MTLRIPNKIQLYNVQPLAGYRYKEDVLPQANFGIQIDTKLDTKLDVIDCKKRCHGKEAKQEILTLTCDTYLVRQIENVK